MLDSISAEAKKRETKPMRLWFFLRIIFGRFNGLSIVVGLQKIVFLGFFRGF